MNFFLNPETGQAAVEDDSVQDTGEDLLCFKNKLVRFHNHTLYIYIYVIGMFFFPLYLCTVI